MSVSASDITNTTSTKTTPTIMSFEMLDGFPVYIKRGRFGEYYTWRGVNCSTKTKEHQQKLRHAYENKKNNIKPNSSENNTLGNNARRLTPCLHLRMTKEGNAYALYFSEQTTEPKRLFFSGFPFGNPIHNPDSVLIEWLQTEYGIVH